MYIYIYTQIMYIMYIWMTKIKPIKKYYTTSVSQFVRQLLRLVLQLEHCRLADINYIGNLLWCESHVHPALRVMRMKQFTLGLLKNVELNVHWKRKSNE